MSVGTPWGRGKVETGIVGSFNAYNLLGAYGSRVPRASFERAENDRINAIYDYHKAFAALESAVGRPLR